MCTERVFHLITRNAATCDYNSQGQHKKVDETRAKKKFEAHNSVRDVGRAGSPRASPAPQGRAAARWRPYPAPLAPARRRGAPSVQYRRRRVGWKREKNERPERGARGGSGSLRGRQREARGRAGDVPQRRRARGGHRPRGSRHARRSCLPRVRVRRAVGSGGNVHVVGLIDVHEPSALSRDEAGEAEGLAAPQGRPPRAPRGGAPHL